MPVRCKDWEEGWERWVVYRLHPKNVANRLVEKQVPRLYPTLRQHGKRNYHAALPSPKNPCNSKTLTQVSVVRKGGGALISSLPRHRQVGAWEDSPWSRAG